MRTRIAAGNWKMNTTIQEGIKLATNINSLISNYDLKNNKIIIATPFTHLHSIMQYVVTSNIEVAAQNCSMYEKGAYTGEVSAEMLKSIGVKYCIIGHSERRQYFNEDNITLYNKVALCLKNEITPIFCIGEKLNERESGKHFEVIEKQITEGLFNFSDKEFSKFILAYEPVWAIGTGKTATPEQAQEIHLFIRNLIKNKYKTEVSENTTILYGGSCNSKNAQSLFSQPDIDGGLIGGASLKAIDFVEIIKYL